MKQGDGTELLGPGDPRNSDIGILNVASTDTWQEIVTAIYTQAKQGRKIIAIVLPEQGKAFRRPIDFDGLKGVRKDLRAQAQLIFIAPSGSSPAEFARQRRFAVYSSLDSFKTTLSNEGLPAGNRRVKSSSESARRPGLLAFGSRRARPAEGRVQGAPPPTPPPLSPGSPASLSPAPLGLQATPPPVVPSIQNQPVPSTPRIDELDTVEMDQSGQGSSGGAAGAAAAGAAAGMLAARGLENDDDALAPPTPAPPQGGPVAPIAQGSATPTGPAVGPGRAGLSSKPLPGSRKGPKPMVLPSGSTPGKTPVVQGSTPRDSGKLPSAPGTAGSQNPPADKGGNASAVAAVAAGAALGTAAMAASSGSGGGVPAAMAPAKGTPASAAGSSVRQWPPPSAPQIRGSSRPPRRPWWKRTLIWAISLIVLIGLLAIGIIQARGGFSSVFGISATVTITPANKLEQDNFVLQALPNSTPDPSLRQIAARTLTASSPTQSATANATGSIEATQATGTLTFVNSTGSTIPLGTTTLTGKDGVQIRFNGPVYVPALSTLSGVPAYAVNPGAQGNIPALDIAQQCCVAGIGVKNPNPFSGGRNAVLDDVIQQSDIDGAEQPLIKSLSQSTESALQKQMSSNERVVDGTLHCPATTSANHKAGDQAKTVTVQVSVKCSEIVYDFAAAQQMGVNLLLAHARSDPTLTPQYKLDGQVVADVISATLVNVTPEKVVVEVQAQGLWVYQFTSQTQQNIKQSLVRLTKANALNRLRQDTGVSSAKISISSGDIMPSSASAITLTIVKLPGAQETSTPTTPTSIPTSIPTSTAPTVTPTVTLGGS